MGILTYPLQLGCGALVCSGCLIEWVKIQEERKVSCSCCYEILLPTHVCHPPDAITELVHNLTVRCGECHERVNMKHLQLHVSSGCKCHVLPVHASLTLEQCASQSLQIPVRELELQAAGNILRRVRHSNQGSENVLRVPSGPRGKVCNKQ